MSKDKQNLGHKERIIKKIKKHESMKVSKTNFKNLFLLICFFKNFLLFKLIKPSVFTVSLKKTACFENFW